MPSSGSDDDIAVRTCIYCNKVIREGSCRYHLMVCQLILHTGNNLVDMIITFIRHNGDYSEEGADVSMLYPSLQADGWSLEYCTELVEELVMDSYIVMVSNDDHYRFNSHVHDNMMPPSTDDKEDGNFGIVAVGDDCVNTSGLTCN